MPTTLGIVTEKTAGEARVALVPEIATKLQKTGVHVLIERGAGHAAQFPDESFKDVELASDADTVLARSDVLLKVQPPTLDEVAKLKSNATLVSYLQPHAQVELVKALRNH